MKNSNRAPRVSHLIPRITVALLVSQVLLVIVSWMVNATMPMAAVRSLLSSEGIRWFYGHFAQVVASPFLAGLLLLSIACGLLRDSRMLSFLPSKSEGGRTNTYPLWGRLLPWRVSLRAERGKGFRNTVALVTVLVELCCIIAMTGTRLALKLL